jgi:hypothetical protein
LTKQLGNTIGLEHGQQIASILVWLPQIILDSVLAHKMITILPPKVVLNNGLADDDVAEQDLVAIPSLRHATAYSYEKGQLQTLVACSYVCRCASRIDFAHL